jgi:hypothetical protein
VSFAVPALADDDVPLPAPPPKPLAPAPAPAPNPEVVTPHVSADRFTFEPFGYLRMQYIAVQDDPNVLFVGRDDGFELQNARIGARGTYGTRVSFALSFDGAVDERAQVNSPQGKLGVGLRDAYADVLLAGQRDVAPIYVRGGYFQTWVDPEAFIADTAREFVDRPIESRGIRATEGYQTPALPPGRSMGVALRLDPVPVNDGVRIGVELAAQNGADEFSSNNDNDALALSAAGVARFPGGWLTLAGRWNPRTVGELPFRQEETDYQGSLGLTAVFGALSVGGGAFVQRTYFETTQAPRTDGYGAHAQAMIHFGSPQAPIGIGYRFGIIDPSNRLLFDRVMEHTAGIVVGVPDLRMRVQMQITHVVEQGARQLDNDRAQIAAEVSL